MTYTDTDGQTDGHIDCNIHVNGPPDGGPQHKQQHILTVNEVILTGKPGYPRMPLGP